MMIPFWNDFFDEGYLEPPAGCTLLQFFPNCNLSVRRTVIEEIGMYDPERSAGEDADLCQRARLKGWKLYYSGKAACSHESRPDFRSLVRQYFAYGLHFAPLYRKYRKHRLEIFLSPDARPRNANYRCLVKRGSFPVPVLLFISWFSLFTLLITAGIVLALAGFMPWALAALLVDTAAMVLIFLRSPLRRLGMMKLTVYFTVTCIIDGACLAGSLVGGVRNRMLFLYPGI